MTVQETLSAIRRRDVCVPSPTSETIVDVSELHPPENQTRLKDLDQSVTNVSNRIININDSINIPIRDNCNKYRFLIHNLDTCLIRSMRGPVLRTQRALYAAERRGDVPLQQRLHRQARREGRLP